MARAWGRWWPASLATLTVIWVPPVVGGVLVVVLVILAVARVPSFRDYDALIPGPEPPSAAPASGVGEALGVLALPAPGVRAHVVDVPLRAPAEPSWARLGSA